MYNVADARFFSKKREPLCNTSSTATDRFLFRKETLFLLSCRPKGVSSLSFFFHGHLHKKGIGEREEEGGKEEEVL